MPFPPSTIPLPGGLCMPAVGLGTFKARREDAYRAVSWALSHGYRLIDTAAIYKNEAEVAAALADSGVPRADVFLTTKISPYQQGTAKAEAACEASLQLLGSIDLVLVHWPGAAKTDAASPQNAELRRQTWRVLERYHAAGRFRAIGVSNYTVRHLEELLRFAKVPPACNQVECHPRYQQRALRDYCRHAGIAVQAYASLGCGELLREPAVAAVAAAAGVTPAQALLLWGLHRGLGVIPKSVQQQRLAEAAPEALLGRELSDAALQQLDALEELLGSCKYCWDSSNIA